MLLKALCASSVAGKERRVGSARHVTLGFGKDIHESEVSLKRRGWILVL